MVFEDLALGKARLIEVMTTTPVSVLEIEDLPSEALTSKGLQAHFAGPHPIQRDFTAIGGAERHADGAGMHNEIAVARVPWAEQDGSPGSG